MSLSAQTRRKARRKAETREAKSLRNLIRKGKMPTFFLAKAKEGNNQLERDAKGKLTWRQVGTFKALMELPEVQNVVQDQSQDPTSTS